MTRHSRCVCCADLGGSWLRLCARKPGRKGLLRARLPYCLGSSPKAALMRGLARLGLRRVDLLIVGARGCWTPREKAALRRKLRTLGRKVVALSDLELAHLAAFKGGPGTLVVGGTGSAGYGRDARGRARRTGGLGSLLGDEGSAFWIGRHRLPELPESRVLRYAKSPDVVRAVAGLARSVLRRAARGDARARAVVREAAESLAALAQRTAARLRVKGRAPLCCAGGLFRDPGFFRSFLKALKTRRKDFLARVLDRPSEEAVVLLPEEIVLEWRS